MVAAAALPAWLNASFRPMRRAKAAGPDDPQRDGGECRREDRPRRRRRRLCRRHQPEAGQEGQGDRAGGDHDRGHDQGRPLGRRPIDERAGRRLGQDADDAGNGHHRADGRRVPLLDGQQVDGEVGSQPVAHVGQEQVERVQRAGHRPARSGCFVLRHLRPRSRRVGTARRRPGQGSAGRLRMRPSTAPATPGAGSSARPPLTRPRAACTCTGCQFPPASAHPATTPASARASSTW